MTAALLCTGCNKRPHEIEEYIKAAAEEGVTHMEYVLEEEGTR